MAFHMECIGSCMLDHRSSVELAWHVTAPSTIRQGCLRNEFFYKELPQSLHTYSLPPFFSLQHP